MATVVNGPVWQISNCTLFLGSECWWEGIRRACAGLSKKSCSFGWRAKHSLAKLSARFCSHQAFVPRCNLQPVSCRELGRWTMAPSCLLLKKAATQIGTYSVDSSACFTGLPQIPKQLTNPTQAETFTAGMARAGFKEFCQTMWPHHLSCSQHHCSARSPWLTLVCQQCMGSKSQSQSPGTSLTPPSLLSY